MLNLRSKWLRLETIVIVLAVALSATHVYAQPVGGDPDGARAAARRAAVGSARAQLEAAQARLKAAEQRIRANAKANPDMTAAQTELDQAQADLDKLSGPVLERLKSNPNYESALSEEAAASAALSKEHAKAVAADPASTRPTTMPAMAKPDDDATVEKDEQSLKVPVPTDGQVTAAVDKMDVKSKKRELETQALAADPTTSQAQARVDAATAKLKQLHAQLDATLLNDPDYKAARDELANARAELTRAAAANY